MATSPNPALPRLLGRLVGNRQQLRQLDQYYKGTQPLSFIAPELLRQLQGRIRPMSINWCRLVVNSLEERLDVDGFRLAETADDDLWRIWQANNLDEGSQLVHVDSFVHGLAFASVWGDPDDPTTPIIAPESAEQMTVEFEPGTTNIIWAAKHWVQDDTQYATLYGVDALEKYAASATNGVYAAGFGAWELIEQPIAHDLGVVPVVPFINRPRLTNPYGESELMDVIDPVDAINKLSTDMMIAAEFAAMPRRWATGVDLGEGQGSDARNIAKIREAWDNAVKNRVWTAEDDKVKFGQFAEASLENFVKGIEMFQANIAAVSGLPPHYVALMSQANPASADALRSAEASLVKRAQRKQRVLGGAWERVMRLAIGVRDGAIPSKSLAMETIWRSPETPTIAQQVDAAVKLDGINMPFRQTLEDLGYTPTAAARIIDMRTTDALKLVEAQVKAADGLVEEFGISRAAGLSAVGLEEAAKVEAVVEARAPGPGVTTDAELAAEVAAATPVVVAPAEPGADAPDPAPAVKAPQV